MWVTLKGCTPEGGGCWSFWTHVNNGDSRCIAVCHTVDNGVLAPTITLLWAPQALTSVKQNLCQILTI